MIKPLVKPIKLKTKKQHRKADEKYLLGLWQEIVKTRVNNTCEFPNCMKSSNFDFKIDAHHIFSKGTFRHLKFDLDNGIALCVQHHQAGWGKEAAHSDPDFKDKILGRIKGYQAVRSEVWYMNLLRRAWTPQKQDLKLEKIYLEQSAEKYGIK